MLHPGLFRTPTNPSRPTPPTGRRTPAPPRVRTHIALSCLILSVLTSGWSSPADARIWTHSGIDSGPSDLGQFVSMAVDGKGRIHVAYRRFDSFSEGSRNPIYATNPLPLGAGAWSDQRVDSDASTGAFCSIDVDWNGVPHLAYYDSELGDLRHAFFDSTFGTWRVEVVDQAGTVGQYASIAARGSAIRIAYFDASSAALKLATRQAGGSWLKEVVDASSAVGLYCRLNDELFPQIAYYDFTHTALKYAAKLNNSWTITTVDQVGDVGQFASIDATPIGTGIAYYDAFGMRLKYAYRPYGGAWSIQVVDETADVGAGTSLAFDGDGRAHITYYDADAGDLRYAGNYGSGWARDVIATAGEVGRYSSVAVDSLGLVNVVYYDETAGIPRYAYGVGDPTGIGDPNLPARLRLAPAMNPVQGPALFVVDLDVESNLRVLLFDARGRRVRELFTGRLLAGQHRLPWDGSDDRGRGVAPGVYFSVAEGDAGSARAKVVRVR